MEDRTRENPLRSLLFTDLYELTMARAYEAEGMEQPAVFELFFRKLPAGAQLPRRRRARRRARRTGRPRLHRG